MNLKSYEFHKIRQNGGDDELGSENEKFVESQMEKASDPYEKVVWSLIGRLPLAQSHLSDIVQTTQDYLWLKLNILPSNHSHQPHHSISLEKIQRKVLESESQFSSKQSNQLLFLHSLLLTLQYQKVSSFKFYFLLIFRKQKTNRLWN